MPVALTAKEWGFLVAAVGPAVVAAAVVWLVWRWARRSDDAGSDRDRPGA